MPRGNGLKPTSTILARGAQLAGTGLLALALAGCSMGNMFGGGTGSAGTQQQYATPTQTEIAQAAPNALPAIATECPAIKVRPGAETAFSYGGKIGDPKGLRWQAVIEKASRNCVVSNGLITVRMGVVGRLLLGPKGNDKSVSLPLRFTVERNGASVFSERYNIPVAITPPSQSEEFVKVVENVAIPYLGGEDITIWVGFEGK